MIRKKGRYLCLDISTMRELRESGRFLQKDGWTVVFYSTSSVIFERTPKVKAAHSNSKYWEKESK